MADHAHHGPSDRHYVGIFLTLAVLTAVTVAISYSSMSHGMRELLALLIATVKAVLVGLIFMHLKYEHRAILAFVIAPLALVVLFIGAIAPDIGTARP